MYFSRIRDLREDNELNQEKAASVLGVTQTTYSKYELGKITVPTESLIKCKRAQFSQKTRFLCQRCDGCKKMHK